jgi:hypothetical protein
VFLPSSALKLGPGDWDIDRWGIDFKAGFLAKATETMALIDDKILDRHLARWRQRLGHTS